MASSQRRGRRGAEGTSGGAGPDGGGGAGRRPRHPLAVSPPGGRRPERHPPHSETNNQKTTCNSPLTTGSAPGLGAEDWEASPGESSHAPTPPPPAGRSLLRQCWMQIKYFPPQKLYLEAGPLPDIQITSLVFAASLRRV
nr:WAS/WASL-interacting protein family member 1-like [Equus caballus]